MLATVTTSAQTLVAATSGVASSIPNENGLTLFAPSTNTENIYFSASASITINVAATAGLPIEPGKAVSIPQWFVKDANLLYVISGSGSQSLFWDKEKQ